MVDVTLIGSASEKYAYRFNRFQEECNARGLSMQAIDPAHAAVGTGRNGERDIIVNGQQMETESAMVLRITPFGRMGAVLENIFVDNGAKHMWLTDGNGRQRILGKTGMADRFAALQVPTPRTYVMGKHSTVEDCVQYFDGQFPLILKAEAGPQTCGIGVMLAESERSLKPLIEYFRSQNILIVVQEFIAESSGIDYRIVVLGDEVIAAVKRDNSGKDFRSNIAQGGSAASVEIDEEMKQIAIRAARAHGVVFGGVDILPSNQGSVVTEVNTPCDFSFVEEVTGVNVVGQLLDYVMAR